MPYPPSGQGDPDGIVLTCGGAFARIALRGAELQTLGIAGLDLLRAPDDVWPATSPILFPIVGWVRDSQIRVAGQAYPMGVHGFAAAQNFTCIGQTADQAILQLVDSSQTRAVYPFGFDLRIHYRLREHEFTMLIEIANPGSYVLPYACGFHPGFRWPFAGGEPEDYAIAFEVQEIPEVPVIAAGGLFSAQCRTIPLDGTMLPLTHDLMADEALCFLGLRSRMVSFGKVRDLQTESGPVIDFELLNMPHLALWSKPPSPFLCVEAWTGHGDPVGFTGELADKPSMLRLAPGATAQHGMRITLRP